MVIQLLQLAMRRRSLVGQSVRFIPGRSVVRVHSPLPNSVRQFRWLECQPVTLEVVGSIPIRIAKYYLIRDRDIPDTSYHGGYSQVVKTAGCGSVMRGFESHYPPHFQGHNVGVSPSGKAMDSDSIMRRFESCYPSQINKGMLCIPLMATQPRGKAEVCKTFIPGSNPGVASTKRSLRLLFYLSDRFHGNFSYTMRIYLPVLRIVLILEIIYI